MTCLWNYFPENKQSSNRVSVRLGPNANLAGVLEGIVVPFDGIFAVECHREVSALKIHADDVPLVERYLHVRPILFSAAAIDGVVDGDAVFECFGASSLVNIRVVFYIELRI